MIYNIRVVYTCIKYKRTSKNKFVVSGGCTADKRGCGHLGISKYIVKLEMHIRVPMTWEKIRRSHNALTKLRPNCKTHLSRDTFPQCEKESVAITSTAAANYIIFECVDVCEKFENRQTDFIMRRYIIHKLLYWHIYLFISTVYFAS